VFECQCGDLRGQVEVAEGSVCTQAEAGGIRSAGVEADRRAAGGGNGDAVSVQRSGSFKMERLDFGRADSV
ncbi:hypothetical protein, partial [Escherichia coli]|uniref:hypothetical protein n=1 Tax=Escherichia coli TaxID=562 RepID=UPI001F4B9EA5